MAECELPEDLSAGLTDEQQRRKTAQHSSARSFMLLHGRLDQARPTSWPCRCLAGTLQPGKASGAPHIVQSSSSRLALNMFSCHLTCAGDS